VIALVVVVSPVLASGKESEGPKRMAGSNNPLSIPMTGKEADAGIIDVTTQPQTSAELKALSAGRANNTQHSAYEVVGPPSLSVTQIEAVLQQYGSPATGKGQALYDLGVKYGVDPAYALAFFVHESACGTTGVARFSKSLGNIRWTEAYDDYEGYRSYHSWEEGMEDWYKLIAELYVNGWDLRTVDEIVPVYAPYGDNNNPPAYIAAVEAMVNSWRGR